MSRRARFAAVFVGVSTLTACTPQEIVGFYFRDEAPKAWEVVAGPSDHCPNGESGGDPAAVSPDGANHGLFQINRVHRRSFEQVTGQPWSAVLDPVHNTRFALWLWERQGWVPWSCG